MLKKQPVYKKIIAWLNHPVNYPDFSWFFSFSKALINQIINFSHRLSQNFCQFYSHYQNKISFLLAKKSPSQFFSPAKKSPTQSYSSTKKPCSKFLNYQKIIVFTSGITNRFEKSYQRFLLEKAWYRQFKKYLPQLKKYRRDYRNYQAQIKAHLSSSLAPSLVFYSPLSFFTSSKSVSPLPPLPSLPHNFPCWWQIYSYRRSNWYRRHIRKNRYKSKIFWSSLFFLVFILSALLVAFYYLNTEILNELPNPLALSEVDESATTKIYDRNHHLLYSLYDEENRTPIALADVSPLMIQATIAIEDATFYEHHGFSLSGLTRAFYNNITTDSTQGGSTITQQLVKNRLLTNEKTLNRKVKELILAVIVDSIYTKDQILEMYLNTVSYGGTIYGVEQAAVSYFGKNASNLTLAESAYLAAITKAPSVYSPYAGSLNIALGRQKEVLRRMEEEGFISSAQRQSAETEELTFLPTGNTIEAPHFVMYIKELLIDQYGEEMVMRGGLEVVTTLDLELYNQAQELITQEVKSLAPLRIGNGASLITNPQTGEILSMVGSTNFWDIENDGQVNVALATRQPGSSIKPLTYSLAFMSGFTPVSKIQDTPFTYRNAWETYSPKNYDGKYRGSVTLRESLGSSYNIPAVKLLEQVGIDNFYEQGRKMGLTTWTDRNRFGLSATLGSIEVRMTDMAVLYGHFANGGYQVPLNPILEIRDINSQIIYQNTCALSGNCVTGAEQNIPSSVAYQITNILSDNKARTPAFGAHSVLQIPNQEVAVKTGTTNSMRDNWTIGYTTDRMVLVWVGNNDNSPMSYVASGITGASPIWQDTMTLILDPNQSHHFTIPNTLEATNMCYGGQRQCQSNCQVSHKEYFDTSLGQELPACYVWRPPASPAPV